MYHLRNSSFCVAGLEQLDCGQNRSFAPQAWRRFAADWGRTGQSQIKAQPLGLSLISPLQALEGTPGMIGYGMAKAAVHQLTASLASKGSGLPEGSTVILTLASLIICPHFSAGSLHSASHSRHSHE